MIENTKSIDGEQVHLFTPRIGNKRRNLWLNEEDIKKIGRGRWTAYVTDQSTNTHYKASGAPCGLNCYCDAVAHEITEQRKEMAMNNNKRIEERQQEETERFEEIFLTWYNGQKEDASQAFWALDNDQRAQMVAHLGNDFCEADSIINFCRSMFALYCADQQAKRRRGQK